MEMTSPIFMLSETLCPILEWIRNDTETLHNCILVNRTWCRVAAPILWRAPFKNRWLLERSSLITTFIGCLDDESKEKLTLIQNFPLEYLKFPTFDYVSFLREFQYPVLYDTVKSWCNSQDLNRYTEDDYYQSPSTAIMEMLIELFMKRSKDLSRLSIPTVTHRNGDYVCLSKHSDIAQKCLPKIRFLGCDDCIPENLIFASKFCTNLDRLDIDCSWGNDREVSKLIKAQKHLQHITVTKRWPYLNDAISIENLRQSLKCVVLRDNKNHQNSGGPLSVLSLYKKLEILRFDSWLSFPEDDMDELASSYFPKLRKLSFTRCKPTADIIISMILVSGSNLQELTLSWKTNQCNEYSVVWAISGNCPNLTYLDVPVAKKDMTHLSNLLRNCKKLQNLTINFGDEDNNGGDNGDDTFYDVDDFLPKMGVIIPESLHQLNIFAPWKFTARSLREFLMNHCRNDFRCLGFYRGITDDHLRVITEYARERKKLNYLELRWCETSCEERKKAKEFISIVAVYNFLGRLEEE